mmetsp:Transcript_40390/g.35848  ORF Transcript_40390/g.35848 Transcript_40390/m.35848 type:complete len:92 (+) Transcript_40390:67-342(+)
MSSHEHSRLYPYVVPGYTGFIPQKPDEEDENIGTYTQAGTLNEKGEFKKYVPGYKGYVPHVRPENMFGKTYGKLTKMAKTGEVELGNELSV